MSEKYIQFYREYKNRLFSYLLSKCEDPETARDIMQESFTRHFQHYGSGTAAISPALLFTIARNALIDHHRNIKRFTTFNNLEPRIEGHEEASLELKEKTAKINKVLATFPDTDREILTMAVSGVPYKEIGAILGKSEANVKVRVHRTRVKLRELLNNEVK